jgi:hypothetical protein
MPNRKKPKAQYYRSLQEASELIWMPRLGLSPDLDEKRNAAVLEVACRLSDDIVETLEAKADSFRWFIPLDGTLAGIFPFPITHDKSDKNKAGTHLIKRYSRVLYLAPGLERTSFEVAVASIVHELAHIVLEHPTVNAQPHTYWANEEAAWKLVDSWGFGREAKKHANLYKRRERDAKS